ncbi:hypothetical protein K503DRAFT_804769 [Rhizopogon vinicolor AM-OR11-026]|uniref:Uncharacterized protein n=1 Tax=Rhizopogon vinicolor AM-OR11-026 TaxID=1314800 RepID=A0A1B7MK24_9AGAM|nr:hypothetical protein K503DRAFT_806009 [Rhizopogon vinicolor AM-OR11-026]OAX32968.1 hypothetical protein K503DRAFT_804769 [Rhizopogon vinicolor AM-OR11-026]
MAEKQKLVMRNLFSDNLLDTQGDTFSPEGVVEFRGEQISVTSLANPPALLTQKITWELFELGFQYELKDLDRWADDPVGREELLHGIFPGEAGLLMWSEPFPSDNYGLWNNTLMGCLPYLKNFRQLLCDWDNVPPCLTTPLTSVNFTDTKSWEVRGVTRLVWQFAKIPPSSTLHEFEEMVKKVFIGQGPYPTYILPSSSKTAPPPSTNPFPPTDGHDYYSLIWSTLPITTKAHISSALQQPVQLSSSLPRDTLHPPA